MTWPEDRTVYVVQRHASNQYGSSWSDEVEIEQIYATAEEAEAVVCDLAHDDLEYEIASAQQRIKDRDAARERWEELVLAGENPTQHQFQGWWLPAQRPPLSQETVPSFDDPEFATRTDEELGYRVLPVYL